MTATVLVTGAGGNVGQGVLRVLESLQDRPLRLVGTSTERVSAGNHLCEVYHRVPFAWDPDYLTAMRDVCQSDDVDLVIPTTDYETFLLASAEELPAVAVSPVGTCETFLDKHLTAKRLHEVGIVFARSALAPEYDGEFDEVVVKPRKGRGSRGIRINPEAPSTFSSDFVVQELYRGVEITTAFYVNRNNTLHGFITFERELLHGMTVACTVTHRFDDSLLAIIEAMIGNTEIRGSCNFQSIVTQSRGVVPFEVNCRISGTSSIRHHLGFRDVEYTIDEYLLKREPKPPTILDGSAVRIFMDVIYPGRDWTEPRDRTTEHVVF